MVEEEESEENLDLSSLSQSSLCQDNSLPFLDDFQSTNLCSESNAINYSNQSISLGNNHPGDDDCVYVFNHEFLGVLTDILVSHEDFDLDLESYLVEEHVITKTSSSSHYPVCSNIFDAFTCNIDTPWSTIYSSNDLTSQLRLGGEIIHDENENNKIIEYSFHSLSSLLLHEENSSNELAHEIFLIHTSSNLWLEEYFNLSNMVVDFEKSVEISEKDGCHLVSSGLIETSGSIYRHTMHDLIQLSECDFTILESSKTC